MGEAKRRKLLDPNFGKKKYKIKQIGLSNLPDALLKQLNFSEGSVHLFEITDICNITRTGNFHFYNKNGKVYARFLALEKPEDDERTKQDHKWFKKHVDELSPLIVEHAFKNVKCVLTLY